MACVTPSTPAAGRRRAKYEEVLRCINAFPLIRELATGKPVSGRGTRIPVHQIVRMLANGDTIEELLQEYPSISREDILACLEYTASLAEKQVTPLEAVVVAA